MSKRLDKFLFNIVEFFEMDISDRDEKAIKAGIKEFDDLSTEYKGTFKSLYFWEVVIQGITLVLSLVFMVQFIIRYLFLD